MRPCRAGIGRSPGRRGAMRRAWASESESGATTAGVPSVGFGDGDRVDDDVVDGPVAATGAHVLHRLDDVEALHHLAEQRVLRWQADAVVAR